VKVVDVVEIFTETYGDHASKYNFRKLSTINTFDRFILSIFRIDLPIVKFDYPLSELIYQFTTHLLPIVKFDYPFDILCV
jgi:hypothetical protein